ncbi:MAG: hypothetical protein BWY70_01588 [Bacteroidetes bacterium ADurb.Bin408]|nr:MAG: hypothetical protein BWY70_01588 [Bacteroidetes bacterium ADurb.Bin408]
MVRLSYHIKNIGTHFRVEFKGIFEKLNSFFLLNSDQVAFANFIIQLSIVGIEILGFKVIINSLKIQCRPNSVIRVAGFNVLKGFVQLFLFTRKIFLNKLYVLRTYICDACDSYQQKNCNNVYKGIIFHDIYFLTKFYGNYLLHCRLM